MKAELRKQLLANRNALTEDEIQSKSHQIYRQLLPYLEQAHCVGIYINFGSEVVTKEMIAYLKEQHKKVCIPACEKQGIMHFYELEEDTVLQQNSMGIWEPRDAKKIASLEMDLILVPMLGFCEQQRLGYGGGYYDRYLAQCSACKIGIAFAMQATNFEQEPYDIHMDIVLHD